MSVESNASSGANSSVSEHTSSGQASSGEYVVVARRYRPQSFQDLVGQGQVSHALTNAINTNRVGHAYLFTGARGVGKTSTARILAKALNCVRGPTPTPCNECDVCQGVSTGDDVDVLEIDGASNRGIDEIRQLRSNVNVRPSRARFKIYIIDEVHMLTVQAFNALLKTLEEPPEHVKFIFCTTDAEKIPITVLSRCQRFDFPPVESDSIVGRLQFIVQNEGVEAETEALQLLARRAGGSMRDSQSLLEQLLSFCEGRITVDDVHRMLGTAKGGSLTRLANCLIERDTAAALQAVEAAIHEGVDVGQLAEQLVGHFRDMMAAAVGCPYEMMLHSLPADFDGLVTAGKRMGLETVLAVVQILDQSVTRMRQSPHVRTLLEVAIVRICKLEDLDELSRLVAQLQSGAAPTLRAPTTTPNGGLEKKNDVAPQAPMPSFSTPTPRAPQVEVPRVTPPSLPPLPVVAIPLSAATPEPTEVPSPAAIRSQLSPSPVPSSLPPVPPPADGRLNNTNAREFWDRALNELEDMTAEFARAADRVVAAAPQRLVVSFRADYTLQKSACEKPDRKAKIEQALANVTGHPVVVNFEFLPAEARVPVVRPTVANSRQKQREVENLPFIQQAKQLFAAEVLKVYEPKSNDG